MSVKNLIRSNKSYLYASADFLPTVYHISSTHQNLRLEQKDFFFFFPVAYKHDNILSLLFNKVIEEIPKKWQIVTPVVVSYN